jgi:hypothetical protein
MAELLSWYIARAQDRIESDQIESNCLFPCDCDANRSIDGIVDQVADQSTRSAMNAATWEDMCAMSNEGVYGIEDYHGIDIGILRSVRLWFVPALAEIPVVLRPKGSHGGFTLGIRISRSEEVRISRS